MAQKVLGQQAPAAATLTDLYVTPGGTHTVVSSIMACNRSAALTSIRIAVRPAGAAVALEHYVLYDFPLRGSNTWTATVGITLEPGDVLSVYSADAVASFSAFGVEV